MKFIFTCLFESTFVAFEGFLHNFNETKKLFFLNNFYLKRLSTRLRLSRVGPTNLYERNFGKEKSPQSLDLIAHATFEGKGYSLFHSFSLSLFLSFSLSLFLSFSCSLVLSFSRSLDLSFSSSLSPKLSFSF